ncbi:tRNA lysidine(34) synthetase TilS [Helcococcus massiliensis]|uniref:tRNA lysidine(34) synthetase TilS n=1 Tax=Helcococcus massiliensis TaxID=2040290 RepID=UPI000CDE8F79|nr:tRNA lysidine(34) synthetase TilS [Helcococcus massiliensis]
MIQKIKNLLEKFNIKNVLLAVSGGVDSMVMLDCFYKLSQEYKINIEIAHFNHKTRNGQSDKDSIFVINKAKELGILCHYSEGDMDRYAKENKISSEEAGRILRHNFFNEILNSKDEQFYLALAHNLDDQVETILMRIIRGTGIDGLEAMDIFESNLFRPLLNTSKDEIISYAKKNSVDYVQDLTNFENIYLRNKIRNQLIPLIKEEYNHNIYDSILSLSDLAKSQNQSLTRYLDLLKNKILVSKDELKVELSINELKNISDYEKIEIIRSEISDLSSNYNFTKNHYNEILKIIDSNSSSIKVINGLVFYKSFKNLVIRIDKANELANEINIELLDHYQLLVNSYLIDIEKISNDHEFINVKIRKRKNGDKLYINAKERKLKDFLIDKKVDAFERDFIPVIELNNKIVQVGDIYKRKNNHININVRRDNE